MFKKITFILLILASGGLLLWLVNTNIPSSGELVVEMKLGKDQTMITQLGPAVRVKLNADYQTVLESPVYFDLRSMPWFTKAQVRLVYQEAGLELTGLGGQTGPGWGYDPQKPLVISDLAESEEGFQEAVFTFDLTKIYQQKNVRRFLIATDPTGGGGELRIKSLKIILSR
ncbi:MAG: hypothetical protein WC675_01925 [Patescibacteria group bacterium]|jgi:hypothetical protein